MTCDQALPASGTCSNYWCRRPASERHFQFIYAIAMRSGYLESAINAYKYSQRKGWASIFGRVLVGYLDDMDDAFTTYDLIVASPTYTAPRARRSWDHIGLILDRAHVEAAGRWPFDLGPTRAIVKVRDTPSLVGKRLVERRTIAEHDIRGSLHIPNPAAIRGRSVLVFDDVFTDGSTLREVARALRRSGAEMVAGIVLARQPWTR
jgi:predicted amidophosphoribosyltransferase